MRHYRRFWTWPTDPDGRRADLLQRGMRVLGQCSDGSWVADCNYKRDADGDMIPPEARTDLPGVVISKGDIGHPDACRCRDLTGEPRQVAMPDGRPRNAWAGEPAARRR